MRILEELCDRLSDEIDETLKIDKLTPSTMEMLDKAVDIIKDVKTIDAMGYSYGDGNSYARGRRYYDGGRGGSRSYGDNMMEKLEDLYDNATSEKDRETIKKLMKSM